ncbi:MAG: hypothetical protein AB1656_16680 [Candidatus Omnitrophota bacterium]
MKTSAYLFAACILAQAGSLAAEEEKVWIPQLDGADWTIAGNPDLGPLGTDKQQPVDFSVWQAADGTWQLWSCIRHTRCGQKTRLFYRWQGEEITSADWTPMGVVMQADPNFGETDGGLQAPYVLHIEDIFYMFYGDWQHICLATGSDGKTFARQLNDSGRSGMFTEEYGANTRDPMALQAGDLFYCYYTAYPQGKGAVYCRISADLRRWSDSVIVSSGGIGGDGPSAAECPFVFFHRDSGYYYLFRTQRYGTDAVSHIYRSKNPLLFGVNDDSKYVGSLPIAAPEIVEHEGSEYIAYLLPGLNGIQISLLKWAVKGQ